jgi:DNA helicase-2/ATP-dependent DNA helicase PcrA
VTDENVLEIALRDLNVQQRAVVVAHEGPLLCVAGAGSGKTTTLTRRVVHMIASGIPPQSILLLTFTRAAAGEMLRRARTLHSDAQHVVGGTFHSIATMTLREYAGAVDLASSFAVLDPEDCEDIIRLLMGDVDRDEKNYPRPSVIQKCVSHAYNTRQKLRPVLSAKYPDWLWRADFIEDIARRFVVYKKERGLLDYDDLLTYYAALLKHPEIGRVLRQRHRFVMIDEYQDCNAIQLDIVYSLGGGHGNVMVVGDPAQAIYGFRGSAPATMFHFLERFPAATILPLETNYRSTQPILALANAVDRSMHPRFERELRAQHNGLAEKPILVQALNTRDEPHVLCNRILNDHAKGRPFTDHAVLVRAMYVARAVEAAFIEHRIPYLVRGGIRITEAAHVKDLLCLGRIVDNLRHEPAWLRLLQRTPRIGAKTAEAILREITVAATPGEAVTKLREVSKVRGLALGPIADAIAAVAMEGPLTDRFGCGLVALEPLLQKHYDQEWQDRKRDLDAVITIASSFSRLEEFLTAMALDVSFDRRSRLSQGVIPETDVVTISTIHSAKGLEWNVVHIPGFIAGNYPSVFANTDAELEEELRCLYVAVTRARNDLIVYRSLADDRRGVLQECRYWKTIERYCAVVPQSSLETPSTSAHVAKLDVGPQLTEIF